MNLLSDLNVMCSEDKSYFLTDVDADTSPGEPWFVERETQNEDMHLFLQIFIDPFQTLWPAIFQTLFLLLPPISTITSHVQPFTPAPMS
jgi:hypothetical protein